VARLLELPLEASGVEGVTVEVRYANEGKPSDERWDVSRSIQEVLDEARANR
jgi:hypothetical protein